MRLRIAAFGIVAATILAPVGAGAQDAITAERLAGEWQGEARFLLPNGVTDQEHIFSFERVSDEFVLGHHFWRIPAHNLKSHDGKKFTYEATEPFLGVIDTDGLIWLTENGDTTMFRLRLVGENRIEFVGLEGGAHPVVGRGMLTRK
jgi:hypothetical protein